MGEPRVEDLRATQVIGKSGVNVAADAGDSGIVHCERGENVVSVGSGGPVENFVVIPQQAGGRMGHPNIVKIFVLRDVAAAGGVLH